MDSFKNALEKKIRDSQSNNFGLENYDEFRFGKFPIEGTSFQTLVTYFKTIIKNIGYKKNDVRVENLPWLEKHLDALQKMYEHLNTQGQLLIIDLIAYRILGYKKVKFARNNKKYWDAMTMVNSLADGKDTFDPHFMHFILLKFDLNPIGYNIKLYFTGGGVATDFILEQYAYKLRDKTIVEVEKGDVVIDAGACWGDTALYFAHKTGASGKVYSFEFIPDNIKLFKLNRSINPDLEKQIELVEHPLSDKTGDLIYFNDNGPGSRIEFIAFEEQTGSTSTITIDDFVKNNNITKVDFIKMDIEGAEPSALEGAIETIRKYKPKLAIAIYHSMDDFVNIPNWILNLNLDYELFIDHYTIHSEETVCFAKPRKR